MDNCNAYPQHPLSGDVDKHQPSGGYNNYQRSYDQQQDFAVDDASWFNGNPGQQRVQRQSVPYRRTTRSYTTYYNGHSEEAAGCQRNPSVRGQFNNSNWTGAGQPRAQCNSRSRVGVNYRAPYQNVSNKRGARMSFGHSGYSSNNHNHQRGRNKHQQVPQWNQRPNHSRANQSPPDDLESPGKPWLTPEILKMIKERTKLYEVYAQEKTEISHNMFKVKQREVKMALRHAQFLYYQQPPCEPKVEVVFPISTERRLKPAFYCNPCEKRFANNEALEEHTKEHITCKLDGCTYTAHHKLVMKHVELQHSTGFYEKISGFNTPEEIEKWKEERRKNFPTPENIARKRAERAERFARGELFEEKDELEDEIYKYKYNKEQRVKTLLYHLDTQSGPGYQSDGDEEYRAKKPKKEKLQPQSPCKKNLFSSLNISPIIRLQNIYTDIELNNHGQLVGSTRKPWSNQDHSEDDYQIKNTETETEQSDTFAAEFNITDDEADQCPIPLPSSITSVPTSISLSPFVSSQSNNKTDECNKFPGLVSYSSDSEHDSESDVEGKEKKEIEDGELGSDCEMTEEKPILSRSLSLPSKEDPRSTLDNDKRLNKRKFKEDPALSSDGEGPDELPAKKVISAIEQPTELPTETDKIEADEKPALKSKRRMKNKRTTKPTRTAAQQCKIAASRAIVKKYSLLQRLLAQDIRRERNLVLQACRFIIENNFFDLPPCPSQVSSQVDSVDVQNKNNHQENKDASADTPTTNPAV